MAIRFDRIAKLVGAKRTPSGGLEIPSHPTRSGVFSYQRADGTERKELRAPNEVFSADSLASLVFAPVTDLHPEQGLVTPDNWKTLSVGHVAHDVNVAEPFVRATIIVNDASTIRAIESGERKELSCGYQCDFDETPGVYEGKAYDAKQVNIRYNHVAIGPENWGRAGNECALRLDFAAAICREEIEAAALPQGRKMKTVRIDGIEYEVGSEAWEQALAKRDARIAKELVDAQTRADAAEKALAEAQARADSAEKALSEATDPKRIAAKVSARAELLNQYSALVKAYKKDAKKDADLTQASDEDLILACLKMLDPKFDPEGKSPDMIRGYFLALFQAKMGKSLEAEPTAEPAAEPAVDDADDTEGKKTVHDARIGEPSARETEKPMPLWKQPLRLSR